VTWDASIYLAAVAAFGGLGQLCLFNASRHAPATSTAPLEYTALIWSFTIGFLVWGDQPASRVYTGAALIAAAGALLLFATHRVAPNAVPRQAG
jgi:drug/metabolite transporter (DMT)-like permease